MADRAMAAQMAKYQSEALVVMVPSALGGLAVRALLPILAESVDGDGVRMSKETDSTESREG